jgi:hypothetical protein
VTDENETVEFLRNIYESILKNRGMGVEQRSDHVLMVGYEEMTLVKLGVNRFKEISMSYDGPFLVFGYRVVEVCKKNFIGICRVIYEGKEDQNV